MIQRKTIENVAHLAMIHLEEDEVHQYAHQLAKILEYFNTIKELETTKIESFAHVRDTRNPLREDEVRSPIPSIKILNNAPSVKQGFYQTPKAFE